MPLVYIEPVEFYYNVKKKGGRIMTISYILDALWFSKHLSHLVFKTILRDGYDCFILFT